MILNHQGLREVSLGFPRLPVSPLRFKFCIFDIVWGLGLEYWSISIPDFRLRNGDCQKKLECWSALSKGHGAERKNSDC
jgi:hypothetical protein